MTSFNLRAVGTATMVAPTRRAPEDLVRAAFFSCKDAADPEGLYAQDIDLLEFSEELLKRTNPAVEKGAQDRCLEFVRGRNPALADALAAFLGR